jgi:hypothetical protein
MFLFQQHYRDRNAEQEQAGQVREEQLSALRDFSKACSDLAGTATVMERESRSYIDDQRAGNDASAQDAINAMEKFFQQLVILQGISGAVAPMFNLAFEECPPVSKRDNSLEASVEGAIARANCEVILCNQMRDKMSQLVR